MSTGNAPALQFSPRQKQLLKAMGYTVWRPVQRVAASQRMGMELDRSAVESPVFKAMLAFVGLDIEQAQSSYLPADRLSLSWELPGNALVLPGTSALCKAAVKRSVWPTLRAMRRSRLCQEGIS